MVCPTGTVKRPDAHLELCQSTRCTSSDAKMCCEAPPVPIPEDCTKMTCRNGYRPKADAGQLFCAGAKCTDDDHPTCCEPKDKPTVGPIQEIDCSSYLCPDGKTSVNDLGLV